MRRVCRFSFVVSLMSILTVPAVAGNEANPDAVELAPLPMPVEFVRDMDKPVAFDATATVTVECPSPDAVPWLARHFADWYGAQAPKVAGGARSGATAFDLEVKVTNLWPNRLIGDDALPADCEWKGRVQKGVKEIGVKEIPQWVKDGKRSPTGRHTFTTWKHWDKKDELLPSGLIGPVLLRTAVFAK